MNALRKIVLSLPRHAPLRPFSYRNAYQSTEPKKRHSEIVKEREKEAKETLQSQLAGAVNFSKEQWNEFAERLIQREIRLHEVFVNANNVDGVILKLCAQYRLVDAGLSYFELIKQRNEHLSDAILSRFLSLCSLDKNYAIKHKKEIIESYLQLKSKAIIEANVAERCISVICLYEDYWRDSFDLLEGVKKLSQPTPSSYCSIAEACFTFGEVELGWQIMRTLTTTTDFKPRTGCYNAYLAYCQKLKQTEQFETEHLVRLFLFLEEFRLNIPSSHVVDQLKELIVTLNDSQFEWSLEETTIPIVGACTSCRRFLQPVNISPKQFEQLNREFVKRVILGSNVFLNTTPKEIDKFRQFLSRSVPYDVVIDGLNVAYSRGAKDLKDMAHTLKTVVAHFARKNMKILVLGRRHMKNWPAASMNYIFENANVFLALNLSQDDPLLLYAALKGGESTCLISRDLMRSHVFLMEDPELKRLFKDWLVSHQYQLGNFDRFGQPNVLPPLPYRPSAQKLELKEPELCWHLPYDDFYLMLPPDKPEPPPKWLCIRRIPR